MMELWAQWTVGVALALVMVVAVVCVLDYLGVFLKYDRSLQKLSQIQALRNNVQYKCLESVPLVIYINMDGNTDRQQWMEDQLTRACSHHLRVSGVRYDPTMRPLKHGGVMTNAEKGCMQAHFDAMRFGLAADVPFALIFEDDASLHFSHAWPESIETLLRRAPPNWDTIRLQGIAAAEDYLDNSDTVQFLRPRRKIYGMGAYLISRQGMLKVKAATQNFTSTYLNDGKPLDVDMISSANPHMNNYILNKWYVSIRNVHESSIQPSIGVTWQWKRIQEHLRRRVFRDPVLRVL